MILIFGGFGAINALWQEHKTRRGQATQHEGRPEHPRGAAGKGGNRRGGVHPSNVAVGLRATARAGPTVRAGRLSCLSQNQQHSGPRILDDERDIHRAAGLSRRARCRISLRSHRRELSWGVRHVVHYEYPHRNAFVSQDELPIRAWLTVRRVREESEEPLARVVPIEVSRVSVCSDECRRLLLGMACRDNARRVKDHLSGVGSSASLEPLSGRRVSRCRGAGRRPVVAFTRQLRARSWVAATDGGECNRHRGRQTPGSTSRRVTHVECCDLHNPITTHSGARRWSRAGL